MNTLSQDLIRTIEAYDSHSRADTIRTYSTTRYGTHQLTQSKHRGVSLILSFTHRVYLCLEIMLQKKMKEYMSQRSSNELYVINLN